MMDDYIIYALKDEPILLHNNFGNNIPSDSLESDSLEVALNQYIPVSRIPVYDLPFLERISYRCFPTKEAAFRMVGIYNRDINKASRAQRPCAAEATALPLMGRRPFGLRDGDHYEWTVSTLREFFRAVHEEFPQYLLRFIKRGVLTHHQYAELIKSL